MSSTEPNQTNLRGVTSISDCKTFHQWYSITAPICIARVLSRYALLLVGRSVYVTYLYDTHLPFVSRYFCISSRVSPHQSPNRHTRFIFSYALFRGGMNACTCIPSSASQNHGSEAWSAPPQNHGLKIALCGHFYVLSCSLVPKQGGSGPAGAISRNICPLSVQMAAIVGSLLSPTNNQDVPVLAQLSRADSDLQAKGRTYLDSLVLSSLEGRVLWMISLRIAHCQTLAVWHRGRSPSESLS